ncbi:hypothetical protein BKA67DRAFT_669353 [Truncatella angustata]|uniref:Uncharacterized protein n=1 Tax=Truncatella angustata TaxID=152316 RepID=A0A9P8UAW4_9PEZI|nr:uncharacterized protein BKA67DRAFT_669353 [Truncatella angustata]KAH6645257.1 hypothetical protein BKA67DRAFT_669353 [Truncatella angustata]
MPLPTLTTIPLRNAALLACALVPIGYAAPAYIGPTLRLSAGRETVVIDSHGEVNIAYCGNGDSAPIHTTGDPEVGPGFWITNNDGIRGDYFLYENSRDERPWKYITIDDGARRFVQVCATWEGHIVRGTAAVNLDGKVHNLGTWAVSSVDPKGVIWGGLSFLQGSDGGGAVRSTDGSGQQRGCTVDVLSGAPDSALATKGSGAKVLDKVVGEGASVTAEIWMVEKCNMDDVYMQERGPNPVIKSDNGRFEWVFSQGRF